MSYLIRQHLFPELTEIKGTPGTYKLGKKTCLIMWDFLLLPRAHNQDWLMDRERMGVR